MVVTPLLPVQETIREGPARRWRYFFDYKTGIFKKNTRNGYTVNLTFLGSCRRCLDPTTEPLLFGEFQVLQKQNGIEP